MAADGTAGTVPVTARPYLHVTPRESASVLEPLLTAVQVGRILGVRPKRVYELGIPAVKLSERSLRWQQADLEAWITARRKAG